ncbi:MAG: right-handed parallel beta-helix repeat-containing protein [Actinomycetota bacterium]|nr:right-handed parallel beta-helix repeat-containing protein [Actinomycetota bacterium]
MTSSNASRALRAQLLRRLPSLALAMAVLAAALVLLAPAPPADAATYEQPVIPDTNYPIPTGAVFVANSGNDGNPGTKASPLRTLNKALSKVAWGGTIVVRGGTYREALPNVTKKITLQPYPYEKVWMKGSDVVTGWVKSGTVWVKTGWKTEFCQNCYDPKAIDPAYPNAGKPDMVFANGAPLAQVASLSAVTAGRFYVDYGADKLYVGTDPTGKFMEASTRRIGLQFNTSNAAGSTVRGIGMAHYSPNWNPDVPAIAVANTGNITFEKDVFAWSASRGVALYGPGPVVRGSTFLYNGFTGITGHKAHRALLEGNRVVYSNQERFSITGSSVSSNAGVKIVRSDGVVIRNNRFVANHGTGIWCDESCYNATIVNNLSRMNATQGISFEISTKGIIASNVVVGNGQIGLKISGSTDVRAFNNTLHNNGTHQVGVYEDSRKNTDSAELLKGITWDTKNVYIKNNLMSVSTGSNKGPILHTYDSNYPKQVGAAEMIAQLNYDGYWRKSANVPYNFAYWVRLTSSASTYTTMAALRTGTGREGNGMSYDNWTTSPYYVDEANGNYNLKAGSPALGSGDPLPSDVASAIGVAAGVKVNRGALKGAGLTG